MATVCLASKTNQAKEGPVYTSLRSHGFHDTSCSLLPLFFRDQSGNIKIHLNPLWYLLEQMYIQNNDNHIFEKKDATKGNLIKVLV